jgi:hypothetical protein
LRRTNLNYRVDSNVVPAIPNLGYIQIAERIKLGDEACHLCPMWIGCQKPIAFSVFVIVAERRPSPRDYVLANDSHIKAIVDNSNSHTPHLRIGRFVLLSMERFVGLHKWFETCEPQWQSVEHKL